MAIQTIQKWNILQRVINSNTSHFVKFDHLNIFHIQLLQYLLAFMIHAHMCVYFLEDR